MLRATAITLTILTAGLPGPLAAAASLRGSPASMVHQNEVARESQYSFLRTPAEVQEFAQKGLLVPVAGGAGYQVSRGVSHPYARPATQQLVEFLGARHLAACGENMVVTSLTRPQAGQPANAHALSVHPTGMAADLRVSRNAKCREWLESMLLSLESEGVLDVTRERNPPHYHIAVFPSFQAYAAKMDASSAAQAKEARAEAAARPQASSPRGGMIPGPAASGDAGAGSGFPLVAVSLLTLGFILFLWGQKAMTFHPRDDWE